MRKSKLQKYEKQKEKEEVQEKIEEIETDFDQIVNRLVRSQKSQLQSEKDTLNAGFSKLIESMREQPFVKADVVPKVPKEVK